MNKGFTKKNGITTTVINKALGEESYIPNKLGAIDSLRPKGEFVRGGWHPASHPDNPWHTNKSFKSGTKKPNRRHDLYDMPAYLALAANNLPIRHQEVRLADDSINGQKDKTTMTTEKKSYSENDQ